VKFIAQSKRSRRRLSFTATAVGASLALLLAGCSAGGGTDTTTAGDGTGSIVVWAHQGQDSENAALQAAVKDFNASQSKVTAKLKLISADTYTSTITSTPANKLADVMEMDGPTLGSYVYNEKVAPLKQYLAASTVSNATPGSIAEGTVNGKLYAVAMYDSALGLFGNKKMLDAAGVKYPTSLDDVWTADEFTADLQKLAASSPSGKALDVHEDYGLASEWGTFAFSPLLWSAGGNLISNDKASGVLDSPDSVKALTTFASWKQYVDPNSDGKAFDSGRVALGWGGHWMYPGYSAALGSDLIDLPLPDFGKGTKTGAGSWTWGISSGTTHGKAAGKFLDYLMNKKNVTAMTTANGAPPATKDAFAADATYASGGPLSLWAEQITKNCGTGKLDSSCVSVDRPGTAGYPVITSKFSAALSAIWGGADVKSSLTTAAKAIDQAFSDNGDYK
jgi:multiple sugar transport system substrate-binding protein